MVPPSNFATTSRRVYRSDFQPRPISLLNTRRIGGTATQVTVPAGISPDRGERDLPTDLLGAAKVTGKLGNFRYGLLGISDISLPLAFSIILAFIVALAAFGLWLLKRGVGIKS